MPPEFLFARAQGNILLFFKNYYLFNCNNYNNKDLIMKDNVITFISNNVKKMKTLEKRMKSFEYRIYSKERLCSKERLPRINAPFMT